MLPEARCPSIAGGNAPKNCHTFFRPVIRGQGAPRNRKFPSRRRQIVGYGMGSPWRHVISRLKITRISRIGLPSRGKCGVAVGNPSLNRTSPKSHFRSRRAPGEHFHYAFCVLSRAGQSARKFTREPVLPEPRGLSKCVVSRRAGAGKLRRPGPQATGALRRPPTFPRGNDDPLQEHVFCTRFA